MSREIIFGTVFSLLVLFSCKEEYYPDIDRTQRVLVVDGLISNKAISYSVRLARTLPFDSVGYQPEENAKVFVTDDKGNRFDFIENAPGNYQSDVSAFKPATDNTYILHIKTKDNDLYESSPQTLLSAGTELEAFNKALTEKIYQTINGILKSTNVKGAVFTAPMQITEISNPYYRFSNCVFSEFTALSMKDPDNPELTYRWIKYNPNEFFILNNKTLQTTGNYQQELGFCPFDTSFYSISKEHIELGLKSWWVYKSLVHYLVSFKRFHLNKDIYDYYTQLNSQLEANQRIFDPVTSQASGNIRCVSDPDKKAFGIFEASSQTISSYLIDHRLSSSSYTLSKIDFDPDAIPESNDYTYFKPDFWIP